jgi:Hsp70 protein
MLQLYLCDYTKKHHAGVLRGCAGKEPNKGINPDEAVAYGAAVQVCCAQRHEQHAALWRACNVSKCSSCPLIIKQPV